MHRHTYTYPHQAIQGPRRWSTLPSPRCAVKMPFNPRHTHIQRNVVFLRLWYGRPRVCVSVKCIFHHSFWLFHIEHAAFSAKFKIMFLEKKRRQGNRERDTCPYNKMKCVDVGGCGKSFGLRSGLNTLWGLTSADITGIYILICWCNIEMVFKIGIGTNIVRN